MAIPTLLGHTNGYGTGSATRTLLVPSGAATDDILVAIFSSNDYAITAVESGWTQVKTNVATGTLRTSVFVRAYEAVGAYNFTIAASAANTHAMLLIRGAVLTDLVVGADGKRTVTGTSTTTVAPSLTTLVDDSVVFSISMDRSTSTEAAVTSVSGATEEFFVPQNGGTGLETIHVSRIDMATAGASGNVTVTYPNVQASNGFSFQLGFAPGVEVAPPHPVFQINSVDVEAIYHGSSAIRFAYWNGALLKAFDPVFTVAELLADNPLFVAHRGLGQTYSEQSMAGYDAAVALGLKALEVSLHVTSDGVFVASHDPTPVRVFGESSTPFSSRTWASVVGFESATGPILRLEQILDKYAGTHVIFLDDKTNANTAALLALIDSYPNPTHHFVWKGFRGWSPAADQWTALGYTSWGIYYDNEVNLSPSYMDKFTTLGLNFDATEAQWDVALATGKRVFAHVIGGLAQRVEGAGKGATGFMVTDTAGLP